MILLPPTDCVSDNVKQSALSGSLHTLIATDNRIRSESVPALSLLTGLRTLCLANNQIDNVQTVVRLVQRLPALTTLDLRNNPISTSGGSKYRSAIVLAASPSLESLDGKPILPQERAAYAAMAQRAANNSRPPSSLDPSSQSNSKTNSPNPKPSQQQPISASNSPLAATNGRGSASGAGSVGSGGSGAAAKSSAPPPPAAPLASKALKARPTASAVRSASKAAASTKLSRAASTAAAGPSPLAMSGSSVGANVSGGGGGGGGGGGFRGAAKPLKAGGVKPQKPTPLPRTYVKVVDLNHSPKKLSGTGSGSGSAAGFSVTASGGGGSALTASLRYTKS